MSNIEIQSKVNNLRELRRMAEELDAEIIAIQDAIKQHMSASGLDELTGADFKITWKDSASIKKRDVSHNLQEIGSYTGLSETAIENLHTESKDAEAISGLNSLLSSNYDSIHRLNWFISSTQSG